MVFPRGSRVSFGCRALVGGAREAPPSARSRFLPSQGPGGHGQRFWKRRRTAKPELAAPAVPSPAQDSPCSSSAAIYHTCFILAPYLFLLHSSLLFLPGLQIPKGFRTQVLNISSEGVPSEIVFKVLTSGLRHRARCRCFSPAQVWLRGEKASSLIGPFLPPCAGEAAPDATKRGGGKSTCSLDFKVDLLEGFLNSLVGFLQ